MIKTSKLREVFSVLPLPILLLETEGPSLVVIDVNKAYLDLTHLSRKDLIGKTIFEVLHKSSSINKEDLSALQTSLLQSIRDVKPTRVRKIRYLIKTEGKEELQERYLVSENIPILDEEGRVELILHTVEDVTGEVMAQKEHAENSQKQQQLNSFIEENVDALFSLDREGYFTSANPRLAAAAEVSMDQLLQMNYEGFCAPYHLEKIKKYFHNTLKGEASKFEADFISGTGNKLILDIALMPIKIGRETAGVYGMAKDITGLRKTENIVVEKKNFLKVNAAFISSLLEQKPEYKVLKEAFAVIGKAVNADRMCYFEAHHGDVDDQVLVSKKVEWTSNTAKPEIDNPRMQNMSLNRVKEVMGPLFHNKPFSAVFSELEEGELKEIFMEQRIKSMLLLPVFVKNDLYGFVGFDDCKREREWSHDVLSFLESLTKNLAAALEKRLAEKDVKKREDQLRKSEQKFQALVQEGSDIMAILDENGKYLFVSETSTNILGIPPKEMLRKNIYDFIHPQDQSKVKEKFLDLQNNKQVKIDPYRYKNRIGKWLWMETTATNLLKDPAVKGIVTNSRDITTIVQQAHEIEQINERYRLAATATQDLIYDWDLERDEIKRHHSGPHKLFGYSEEEVNTRQFWRQHIHPGQLTHLKEKLYRHLNNPKEFFINSEYLFQRADGSFARVIDKGYIIRDPSGKAIRLIGATSDISEIREKEEALEIANERFNMAMEATNEMIWDWDISSGTIVRSQAFKEVYGYSLEADVPPNEFWFSKTSKEDRKRVTESLYQTLEDPDQVIWKEEYRIYRGDGSLAHVIDRAYISRGKDGKATRMVGAVLDVTESRHLLRNIKRQNKILKEIAWEQSHVVRAPLARLKGLIYLLEIEVFDEMERKEIIGNIKESANELDEIVKRIVSRTEEIELDPDSEEDPVGDKIQ